MHGTRDPRDPLSRALERVAAAAAAADARAPYDHDEFLRRSARRDAQAAPAAMTPTPPAAPGLRPGVLRVAAVLVPAGLLAALALIGRFGAGVQPRAADVPAAAPLATEVRAAADDERLAPVPDEPALVNVAAASDRVQIEDHIAFMDALLNEAAAAGVPAAERAALIDGRRSLAESLRHVRRAELLLASY